MEIKELRCLSIEKINFVKLTSDIVAAGGEYVILAELADTTAANEWLEGKKMYFPGLEFMIHTDSAAGISRVLVRQKTN